MSEVIPLHPARMSEAEYERERTKLRDLYGDSTIEAVAKRDQALAVLFYRSGWTQEELANKEGKSPQRIAQALRFGRFTNFSTTVENPIPLPKNLTERRFRSFWERTEKDGNERIRFRDVLRLMHSESITSPRRPSIGEQIKKAFADGKWRSAGEIAETLELDVAHVRETLDGMAKNQTYNVKCEHKTARDHKQYRLYPMDKKVSLTELIEKLSPIIEQLKAEGKKNYATSSPSTVARLAALLQRQIEEWSQ